MLDLISFLLNLLSGIIKKIFSFADFLRVVEAKAALYQEYVGENQVGDLNLYIEVSMRALLGRTVVVRDVALSAIGGNRFFYCNTGDTLVASYDLANAFPPELATVRARTECYSTSIPFVLRPGQTRSIGLKCNMPSVLSCRVREQTRMVYVDNDSIPGSIARISAVQQDLTLPLCLRVYTTRRSHKYKLDVPLDLDLLPRLHAARQRTHSAFCRLSNEMHVSKAAGPVMDMERIYWT